MAWERSCPMGREGLAQHEEAASLVVRLFLGLAGWRTWENSQERPESQTRRPTATIPWASTAEPGRFISFCLPSHPTPSHDSSSQEDPGYC